MPADNPTDPRAKEAALHRLRDASSEELAVFGIGFLAELIKPGEELLRLRSLAAKHEA